MAKESCISSQNGAEHSMSPVDRLVKELSLELRGLLRKVLNVPENDMHALYDLRQLHGEGVYELDRQIRELITQYQCHPEAMKEALLIRLNFLDASSEAPSSINAPGTGRPTADSTGEWSIPPSSESISALSNLEFVKGEATDGKKRQMLATALSMKDINDLNMVMRLAEGYTSGEDQRDFLELVKALLLRGNYEKNRPSYLDGLKGVVTKSKDHSVIPCDAEEEEVPARHTIPFDTEFETETDQEPPQRYTRKYDLDKMSSAPGPEVASEPIRSEPAPNSQKMRRAAMFAEALEPDMNSQRLLEILNDEGRQMVDILLAEEDIRSQSVLTKLEVTHKKRGFILLATCISNETELRDLIKTSKAKKDETPSTRLNDKMVKLRSKLGSALLGSRPSRKKP